MSLPLYSSIYLFLLFLMAALLLAAIGQVRYTSAGIAANKLGSSNIK